ncbi:MAG TPA: hypothetical protein VK737_06095 [Opitutales bacterium]|nr:hypothetical protein [Opitutales bacterium]
MEFEITRSRNTNNSRRFLITALAVYIVYATGFWLGGGFNSNFWQVDWLVFSKLCLIVIPSYVIIAESLKRHLFSYDLAFLLFPFLIWFLLAVLCFSHKSLFNAFFVEPEIIMLLSGIYFLIVPLHRATPKVSRRTIGILLTIVISFSACGVAMLVPFIPE